MKFHGQEIQVDEIVLKLSGGPHVMSTIGATMATRVGLM